VAVRIHVKEQPTMWKRFNVRWTPTVLVLGPDGSEVRRIEGFLPRDELLGQLQLALAFLAVNRKDWATARQEFERVVEQLPDTEAAPEALYWSGVSKYSASHDVSELKALGRQFKERYTDTSWAKRASIW
jgi:outer membrane protein assembly factor BamD (BamD/ComL family)